MVKFYGVDMRHLLDHFFNDELNELGEYIETSEGVLKRRFDEFADGLERRTAMMSPEAKDHYVEMIADEAFQIADRFPSMVRKTSFVYLYGLFEHTLLNLCGHVKNYGEFKEEITGGKDKGITAAQSYLKNVAKVKFPDQSREWNEIKQMAEIRNFLSHRQGRVKGEPSKALLEYIKRKKGLIELTGMNEIKFNAGYCEDAIEVIRKFFAAVLKAVPDRLLRQSTE
jgi:hypothetical protein